MFVGGIFLSEKIILKEKKKERERERIPDRQIPFLSLSHSLFVEVEVFVLAAKKQIFDAKICTKSSDLKSQ